jgi:hypothetical protein
VCSGITPRNKKTKWTTIDEIEKTIIIIIIIYYYLFINLKKTIIKAAHRAIVKLFIINYHPFCDYDLYVGDPSNNQN